MSEPQVASSSHTAWTKPTSCNPIGDSRVRLARCRESGGPDPLEAFIERLAEELGRVREPVVAAPTIRMQPCDGARIGGSGAANGRSRSRWLLSHDPILSPMPSRSRP